MEDKDIFREQGEADVLNVVCVISNSATPRTVTRQAPLSMGFSRQEHWSGLLFPSPLNVAL